MCSCFFEKIEEAGEPSTAVTTDAEEPSKAASKVKVLINDN